MIIIKIIILYFIQIRHTDDFPPTGTLLVSVICVKMLSVGSPSLWWSSSKATGNIIMIKWY